MLPDFLDLPAHEVAPQLLGCILEREISGVKLRGKIVETEAYDETDAASHSYKHKTERTKIMFGPSGFLYVYFTYGMHYCCNVVTGSIGNGAAVLIRALEPLEGIDHMEHTRGRSGTEVANGPAKLCQALCINKELGGHDLRHKPLRLLAGTPLSASHVVQTTRVGISQAKDIPWRFYIKGNDFVSRL